FGLKEFPTFQPFIISFPFHFPQSVFRAAFAESVLVLRTLPSTSLSGTNHSAAFQKTARPFHLPGKVFHTHPEALSVYFRKRKSLTGFLHAFQKPRFLPASSNLFRSIPQSFSYSPHS